MDLEHVPEELKIAFVRMLGDKSLSPWKQTICSSIYQHWWSSRQGLGFTSKLPKLGEILAFFLQK